MLRNRSRAVTTSLMTDHSSTQSSPSQKNTTSPKPTPSLFCSPRFKAFPFNKGLPSDQSDPVMSPTSILDTTKPFPHLKNPFWIEANKEPKPPKTPSGKKQSWDNLESKGIGVALIDHTPINQTNEQDCANTSRMVLFGTKLRVQIPPLPNSTVTVSPTESPKSFADFGIKTRSPQLSVSGAAKFGIQTKDSPRVFTGCLSISEMELSEDYTCVIFHGPNPKTTHIFDNCIVENCCSWSAKDKSEIKSSPTNNFLSSCYTCKKNLEQKDDIYIYRGEKAFCSRECRHQEMILDGEEENDASV